MNNTAQQKKLLADLDILETNLKVAKEARDSWVERHLEDFAQYAIGTEIVDSKNGRLLGKVSKHYTSGGMYIHYEYQTPNTYNDDGTLADMFTPFYSKQGMCFDNTSRQYISVCTREEYDARKLQDAIWLVEKSKETI